MALVLADRVRDTTTTTSTGTVTLSGTAPTGYQTFATAIGNGNTTYYTINAGFQWEVGIGTFTTSGNTLTRTTVLSSSSGGALVDFAVGTKDVFVTYPAEKSVNYDASNNVGIGTTSPGYKLDVSATGNISGQFKTSGSINALFLADAGTTAETLYVGTVGNDFRVVTGSNERMRITSAGNVLVGTTTTPGSPNARIVAGGTSDAGIQLASTSGGGALILAPNGAGTAFYTYTGAVGSESYTERMRINSSGNVGIGTTAPAAKLDVTATNGASGLNVLTPYGGNAFSSGVFTSGNNSGLFGGGFGLKVFDKNDNGGGGTSGYGVYVSSPYDGVNASGNTYSLNKYGIFVDDLYGYNGVNAANTWGVYAKGGLNNYFAGNVGIGTTAPAKKLTVYDNQGGLRLTHDFLLTDYSEISVTTGGLTGTSAMIRSYRAASDGYGNEGDLRFYTNVGVTSGATEASERMRIDRSGNVGIGVTAPNGKMEVSSSASGSVVTALTLSNPVGASVNTGVALYFNPNGAASAARSASIQSVQSTSGNYADMRFFTAPGDTPLERMRINSDGNVMIGSAASPSAQLTVIPTSNPANATGTLQTAIGEATNNSAYQMRMGYYLGNTYQGVINVLSGGVGADLLLNPSGGGVVIGSNLPRSALNISRTGSTASVEASASIVLTNRSTAINGTIMGGIFANTFRDVADPHYTAGIWFTRNQTAGNAASTSDIVFATIDGYNEVNVMPTERMRITPAGLVAIGTTAPNAQLTVVGTGNAGQIAGYRNTLYLKNSNPSGNQSNAIVFGSNGGVSSCSIINDISANGTTVNRLDVYAGSGGGVFLGDGATAWASASDERGKDIIEPILNAVQKVGTLRAVIGKYKTDAEGTRRSFLIAQDVQAVLPEAVNVGTDEQQTLGVAYTDTIPLLVAAIKELTARVAQLEGK